MKTAASLLVLFFFISVATILLNECGVDAGRQLKRTIVTSQSDKSPSGNPNLFIKNMDVAPSGPNHGGNSNTQSILSNDGTVDAGGDLKRNIVTSQDGKSPSDNPNLLIKNMDVAPSGPNHGGNSNIQSVLSNEGGVDAGRQLKRNIVTSQADKSPSDDPNHYIKNMDVAQSGPNHGGNSNTQSILSNDGTVDAGGDLKRNIVTSQDGKSPSDNPNLLIKNMDVAPSGPNHGGNSNIQSVLSNEGGVDAGRQLKRNIVTSQASKLLSLLLIGSECLPTNV